MGSKRPVGRARIAAGLLLVALVVGLTLGTQARSARSAVGSPGQSHGGWASVPLAARALVSAALGSELRAYRVHPGTDGAWHAVSPAEAMRATFTAAGVRVSSAGSMVVLRLAGLGRAGSLARIASVTPSAYGNRITYSHAGVTEWYANSPLGIEQGFTIPRRPSPRGTGPLTLSVALSSSLRAALSPGRRQLELRRGGRVVLAYRDLVASDASGRRLSARLSLSGRRLSIMVADRGARYPLRVDPLVQQAELTPAAPVAGDSFGAAVAISGDGSTITVGAPGSASDSSDPGAVYVFTKPASGWAAVTAPVKLTATGGAAKDFLGDSVAISSDGKTIVAGARKVNSNTGAAYVFVRSGAVWTSESHPAVLTNSAGNPGDLLGYSVAVSGDGSTVVAGGPQLNPGPGAGYVFTEPAAGPWTSETSPAILTPNDPVSDPDPAYDLGWSAAISTDGSSIVLGASGQSNTGNMGGQGSAYVYVNGGGAWTSRSQTAKLTASDGGDDDQLGTSVATSSDGSTIVAGAPSTANPGAVYVFKKPTTGGWGVTGNQAAKLTASDASASNGLGNSVAISPDATRVVAGADTAGATGSAYVFDKPSGSPWTSSFETQKLTASDGAANDQFGYSVAASTDGSTIVAGATNAKSGSGAAYPFASAGSSTGSGPFPLNVAVSPSGGGTVTSQPAGISCPSSCTAMFAGNTSVTLTATPAGGQVFGGWSGDCAATTVPTCTTTMSEARSATAFFNARAATKLSLSCSYSSIALAEVCVANVAGGATRPSGQVVFLSSSGAVFTSGNACTLSASASCQVNVESPPAAIADAGGVTISATYGGDATHAASAATAQYGTSAQLAAEALEIKQACGQFIESPIPGGGINGAFTINTPNTILTAQFTAGLEPGSALAGDASASDAATSSCDGSVGAVTAGSAAAAHEAQTATAAARAAKAKCRTTKVRGHKRKVCAKRVVVAKLAKTFRTPGRYVVHIPVTAAGKRVFKALAALDKAYLKRHHHHGKPPRLKLMITISLKPQG